MYFVEETEEELFNTLDIGEIKHIVFSVKTLL